MQTCATPVTAVAVEIVTHLSWKLSHVWVDYGDLNDQPCNLARRKIEVSNIIL